MARSKRARSPDLPPCFDCFGEPCISQQRFMIFPADCLLANRLDNSASSFRQQTWPPNSSHLYNNALKVVPTVFLTCLLKCCQPTRAFLLFTAHSKPATWKHWQNFTGQVHSGTFNSKRNISFNAR